jgi:hypothetical protein
VSPNAQRLLALAKLFDLKDFVETGTQNGSMFRAVQSQFERTLTIEIDGPPLELVEDFGNSAGIFLIKGSSGDVLGDILKKHEITRALFWLDAHGNQTFFKDDGNNQVPKELEAITQYAPNSLVVVDDVTWEKGKDGQLRRWVNSSYEFLVPEGWFVKYVQRAAILHRGGYSLLDVL